MPMSRRAGCPPGLEPRALLLAKARLVQRMRVICHSISGPGIDAIESGVIAFTV